LDGVEAGAVVDGDEREAAVGLGVALGADPALDRHPVARLAPEGLLDRHPAHRVAPPKGGGDARKASFGARAGGAEAPSAGGPGFWGGGTGAGAGAVLGGGPGVSLRGPGGG